MEQFIDNISKLTQTLEGIYFEESILEKNKKFSYFIMNGRTYSTKKMFNEDEEKVESLIISNDNGKGERFNIVNDEKFKNNFIKSINKIKLESLYKSEMESWLMIFEKQLLDKEIKSNKKHLKKELDTLFNSNTIQEREVRLSKILLNYTNRPFFITPGMVNILENDIVIGTLDIYKIM